MLKKYQILKNRSISINGRELYRIQALKDFKDVKKGDIGGFIEKSSNLNHKGDCWIYNNALVYGNANVRGNATVRNVACVYDNATIFGDAKVSGNAHVCDNSKVGDNAIIDESALISDNSVIKDNTKIYGTALIKGNTKLYGRSRVFDNAMISDVVASDATICKDAFVNSNYNIAIIGPINQYKRNMVTIYTDFKNHICIATDNKSGLIKNCNGLSISEFVRLLAESKKNLSDDEFNKYMDMLKFVTYIFRPSLMEI